ncbi:tetraspanin-2A isoform X2 [Macrosteles quadrilineatus]|uniref:tetraspanin-2A isoform X2 n=1 Tax=Macrosteles quadrilineatus TaxID=74068 RepID=UPI0023E23A5C|nr:tetraspanin-2A isoform X2 [Macrosteles quadrilineatus]
MASADKLEKSISTIKYFLFCLDVVTFGLGLTVFGLSLWLWWEDEFSDIIDYLDIYLIYWGLYLIMLKAVLVIFVSFFACASALLENTNSIAQLVLFVLGLLGAAVLLTFTSVGSATQSTINSSMVNLITYYPQNDWANGRLSFIQENVGCCGGSGGPNDYVNRWKPLPTECRDSVTGNAFFYGCAEEVTWYLEGRCYWITGLTLVLCFFHVINSVLSFILLQSIRKEEEESGGRYN